MPSRPDDALTFGPLTAAEWPAVQRIYRAGIATGHATFEAEPPTWEAFAATRRADLRLVATDASDQVLAWAAAGSVSERCVYAGVVEHSVYVDPSAQGRGVGTAVLRELVASAERAGVWTVQSGIFPENRASLRLHEALGFRVVGVRERVGLMSHGPLEGVWRDVVFIERRSRQVGG